MAGRWEWFESRNEWRLYDAKIQDILNDAYKNDKEKVKFTFNDTEFQVEFKFMIQKNTKTHFERPLRFCVKSSDDDNYYTWQWQDEGKKWLSYLPMSVIELEKNYHKEDVNEFELKISDSIKYKIDLENLKQTNEKTKTNRKIKRVKSDCVELAEIKNEKSDDETSQSSNKGESSTRSLRKRKLNKSGSDVSTESDDIVAAKLNKRSTNVKKELKDIKSENVTIKEENEEVEEEENVVIETKKSSKKKKVKKEESDEEIIPVKSQSRSQRAKKEEKKNDDDDDEEEDNKPLAKSASKKEVSQMKTIKFTGRIPVDETFLETANESYHVYTENGVAYDCMLNQTNLQFNNNKYYLIQLLENDKTKNYCIWFRWGRVGNKGQTSLQKFGNNLEMAKDVFEKKFFDKTRNEWNDKDCFEKVSGKYDIVHKDYSAENEDEEIEKKKKKDEELKEKGLITKSKLDERVQKIIEFVCNVQEMENMLKEMKYDAKKAPLGKLSANQIKAGYAALKKIDQHIQDQNFDRDFINACNEFYTRIPHDFGMRVPETIRTKALLRDKLQLLEALGDIEVAIKALNQASDTVNPIDRHYEQLDCIIRVLDKNEKMYNLLENYLRKTHAPTHCTYKMKLLEIFEVDKEKERERFKDVGNRMLLWHGSRNTNWAGILSSGLRIAPPEAPVTGYMFGKGCYFADCSSKSANYCYASKNKNIGFVSLSEVSLGNQNELINADNDADKLPPNKHSTKGLGRSEPDKSQWVKLDDDCVVPCGDLVATSANNQNGYTLLYNEYIVYDPCQIKMKYLLKIEFDFD